MKRKLIGIIVGLLIIATCFFSVTANYNLQLKKDLYNNESSSSLNLLNENKLGLDKSKVLKESCGHFAYFSSDNAFCWIYKGFLYPPYNTTCVCGQPGYSMDFFSSGTWTIDERLLVTEYSNGALCEIDLENCDVIFIGGGGVGLNGLTYDPIYNKVYGCSSAHLYEIDPETGAQELIGSFNTDTFMIEIACDSDGVMYGWDVKFSGESYLYEIDKNTGEASIVGGMGMTLCYAQDGDFCRECDILYLAANVISPVYGSYLVECDEETGVSTILDSFAITPEGFFVIPDKGNPHPIAEFIWTPLVAEPYIPVNFNASESYDSDGYITLYEWDWDNDGIFDENYTSPTATHFWEGIGDFPVTLRVVDNDNMSDSKTKTVRVGNRPPLNPIIDGSTHGKVGVEYEYNFSLSDLDDDSMYLRIDWENRTPGPWQGPYDSGTTVELNHTWLKKGTFIIRAQAKDIYGMESEWSTFKVIIPRTRVSYYSSLFFRFLEQFPNAFPILKYVLGGKKH